MNRRKFQANIVLKNGIWSFVTLKHIRFELNVPGKIPK
jgi:hypothetical protein